MITYIGPKGGIYKIINGNKKYINKFGSYSNFFGDPPKNALVKCQTNELLNDLLNSNNPNAIFNDYINTKYNNSGKVAAMDALLCILNDNTLKEHINLETITDKMQQVILLPAKRPRKQRRR